MSVKIMSGDYVIEATSAAELAMGLEAIESLKKPSTNGTKRGPGRPRKEPPPPGTKNDKHRARAVQFLEAIENAGPSGIAADRMVKVLNAKGVRGLGNPISHINKQMVLAGYKPETVYEARKKPGEAKAYFAREQINAAIAALR